MMLVETTPNVISDIDNVPPRSLPAEQKNKPTKTPTALRNNENQALIVSQQLLGWVTGARVWVAAHCTTYDKEHLKLNFVAYHSE